MQKILCKKGSVYIKQNKCGRESSYKSNTTTQMQGFIISHQIQLVLCYFSFQKNYTTHFSISFVKKTLQSIVNIHVSMFFLNNERISDISLELAGKFSSLNEILKDCSATVFSIWNNFLNLSLNSTLIGKRCKTYDIISCHV